jgi:hypothetical protein
VQHQNYIKFKENNVEIAISAEQNKEALNCAQFAENVLRKKIYFSIKLLPNFYNKFTKEKKKKEKKKEKQNIR